MVFVVLCFALVLAQWTTATPIYTPTGSQNNRTKRCFTYPYSGGYNPWQWCNNQYYNPCYDPCQSVWPTATPQPTVKPTIRPTYPTPWPTYWPTHPPTTRPPYTPIWPTQTPRPTRPPYTPIMPTRPPIPTRPPYTPIWPTRPPIPTRPPYTPIMPTRPPIPTRPPYTPIMPTRPPIPTRPPYTPIWPTRPPIPTRPPYTPIMPTRPPIPTRPPYTPIMPTRPPIPTRPPYTPIMPTRPPIPTRPPYTPIWPTRPPIITRPPYTPIMPTMTPYPTFPTVTEVYKKRGCNRVCVDEHKMYYCCDTTTTEPSTTAAYQGTCPTQINSCTMPVNHNTESSCMFDYQCPNDHGCCYDYCLQEYKCRRLVPYFSTTPVPHLSHLDHYHEDETRVERSLHEEKPAAALVTLAANDTEPQILSSEATSRRHHKVMKVVVMVDEKRQSSGHHIQQQLQTLTRLRHPSIPILFLPLHPAVGNRRAVWEVVQCAARAATQQKAALYVVGCVLAAPTPSLPRLDSLLSSVRQCGREHHVSWTSLQHCVEHGKGRSMLRGGLLHHSRLLQATRKHQLTAGKPAPAVIAAVLAINGTVVEGAIVPHAAAAASE